MAAAFAALLVAALTERVGVAASRLLAPLMVASVATVLYWGATELAGSGDLCPYAFAQFYPLVAIPRLLALFPERYTRSALWVAGLGLYGVAKLAEAGDDLLYRSLGVVSGHTLKHLAAAAGVAVLAWMLRARAGAAVGASSEAHWAMVRPWPAPSSSSPASCSPCRGSSSSRRGSSRSAGDRPSSRGASSPVRRPSSPA